MKESECFGGVSTEERSAPPIDITVSVVVSSILLLRGVAAAVSMSVCVVDLYELRCAQNVRAAKTETDTKKINSRLS